MTADHITLDWQPAPLAPLGVHCDETGASFAVASEFASSIELCCFDDTGEERRYTMFGPQHGVFHGKLPSAKPGLRYGFRASGPQSRERGLRFDSANLLLDPHARAISGRVDYAAIYGPPAQRNHGLSSQLTRARTPFASHEFGKLHNDADVVLYESHVKSLTQLCDRIDAKQRGKISALAHPLIIEHLHSLGINALSLLPIQYPLDEPHLHALKLSNYWRYNTLGFFCLDPSLCESSDCEAQIDEFRTTAQRLRKAGIELILDIVFNHSAEGGAAGPILSFKGLDNRSWYLLPPEDFSEYLNYSGCGNTLNLAHPKVMQWAMDCMRYWLQQMGVSGFRFDLATVLGRDGAHFSARSNLLSAMLQDPIIGRARLITEPWDCGPNGYQVGHFPAGFYDWNDQFRDTLRRFWLRKGGTLAEFAKRFLGSSDRFQHSQRTPLASVNFVVAHDGFSLADVVSFDRKQNHANGENNRDGRDHELAHNFTGTPTTRNRVKQALQASVYLAQGTPMLLAGSEFAHSQQGNNNAYCQDNAISWLAWGQTPEHLQRLSKAAASVRARFALLRHADWFSDNVNELSKARVAWHRLEGSALTHEDWNSPSIQSAHQSVCASYFAKDEHAPSLLLAFNASDHDKRITPAFAADWNWLFDSTESVLPNFLARANQALRLNDSALVPAHGIAIFINPHLIKDFYV
jgi:isoamylase